jgi:hypothetical protein
MDKNTALQKLKNIREISSNELKEIVEGFSKNELIDILKQLNEKEIQEIILYLQEKIKEEFSGFGVLKIFILGAIDLKNEKDSIFSKTFNLFALKELLNNQQ